MFDEWNSASGFRKLLDLPNVSQEEKAAEEMIATMNEGVVDMLEYKDDGYIELIFKLLARICDGQHFGLQVQYISHMNM